MPYASIADLPESVKDGLSEHEQEIFLAAFNSAFEAGKSEESCFKIAWAAAKGETKKEAGNMEREQANGALNTAVTQHTSTNVETSASGFYNPDNTTGNASSGGATHIYIPAYAPGDYSKPIPWPVTDTVTLAAPEKKMRMLNVSLGDATKFQELDGGLLVKDVIILAEGTWTDSAVQTPLFYPAKVLQQYADNWADRSLWVRHAGKLPRSITDKVGSVKNTHYSPQYRAIMGDLFFHRRTQSSKDASELVRCGEVNAVSVEHGGEERFNSALGRMEAATLTQYGCALVDVGACEVCKIRHQSKDASTDSQAPQVAQEETPQQRETDTMDEELKKALAGIEARLKALEESNKPAEVKPEIKEAEMPKPEIKALTAEDLAKALEPIAQRLTVLEKKPEPRSLQPKEDEKSVVAPEIKVRSRSMSQGDF